MELCSIGHDEVCYETGYCPACTAMKILQDTIDTMWADNDRLTIELDNMQKIMDAEEMEKV